MSAAVVEAFSSNEELIVHPSMSDLGQFQSPESLHAKVTPEVLAIPKDEFFRSSEPLYQKYREAWAASLLGRGFASHVRPCEVRLIEEEFPDFEIRTNGQIHAFEFTEVQQPETRRGDHYKKNAGKQVYGIDIHHATVEEGAAWINNGIAGKAAKHYGTPVHLLVYANFWVAEGISLDTVRSVAAAHSLSFKSVWLLFSVCIGQIWESQNFGRACQQWQEIPGYLLESERRMGIVDNGQ